MDFINKIDADILLWIQEYLRNGILTPIMKFITHLGDAGLMWIAIALLLLCFKKTRKVGAMCACALVMSLLINNVILKPLIARVRPYEVIDGLVLLVKKAHDFSFPSGHTASSFACAVVIFKQMPKKYGIPALVMAFIMGFTRLYIGIHYPTDVLAAIVTGTLCAIIGMKIVDTIIEKRR
ncbi:MAG: phosphatase PAP2 family protein [Lachnospiraceae bacterium]|nr:phosphatase PAP2 family protein [Lachnospira sp.]MBR6698379.1 phosphatase PAP2 family protein [Lachnospiraceae bacterium]